MRRIDLCIEPDVAERLLAETGGGAALHEAIGRLAMWHLGYGTLRIEAVLAEFAELVATYLKDDGTPGYVIVALWRGGVFEFHS